MQLFGKSSMDIFWTTADSWQELPMKLLYFESLYVKDSTAAIENISRVANLLK